VSGPVRTLLFTGPGGAGTSTVAAAAAVRTAGAGARTVLLSRQEPRVTGLDRVPGLTVVTVDPQRALERLWRDRGDDLADVLPQVDVPPASSVVPLPGTGELALLAEMGRADADAEVVVVDAGPLERVTALLALPGTLRWWLDQALPPRLRALGAVRTAALRAGAVRRGPVDALLSAVPAVESLLERVALTDPGRTRVRLVTTAQRDAAAALRAAATTLGLLGQHPAGVLARVLPGGGEGEWWARRAAEQEAALAAAGEVAEVVRVPELPQGAGDVADLAGLLPDALPDPPVPPGPAPERLDGGWRLVLPLPFAERGAVDLTRWADDLVVTAAGVRRSVRLDALLRRCEVTGGRLADPGTATARLEVTFVPDPGLWPAGLLAAEGGSW
jgi:arsenite-transporting ATPase